MDQQGNVWPRFVVQNKMIYIYLTLSSARKYDWLEWSDNDDNIMTRILKLTYLYCVSNIEWS